MSGDTGLAAHSIGKTVRVRTRTLLFVVFAGGLTVGAAAAGAAAALASDHAPASSTLRARLDVADGAGTPTIAGFRDASGRERDSRRLDAAGVAGCAALLLGAGWWFTSGGHARQRGIPAARGNRTRAPPCLPAVVCS